MKLNCYLVHERNRVENESEDWYRFYRVPITEIQVLLIEV